MWRQQKGPFVWNASAGGIISLQPRGASSYPRTVRIVHPCSFVDSWMHTSMEQFATIEIGKPFGRTKPSLS